jgi:hypothetical protein
MFNDRGWVLDENGKPREVHRDSWYPMADGETMPAGYRRQYTRIRATGEYRYPRRGEWFLSGAIVEAYRAHSDLSVQYAIAELASGTWQWVPDA